MSDLKVVRRDIYSASYNRVANEVAYDVGLHINDADLYFDIMQKTQVVVLRHRNDKLWISLDLINDGFKL